MEFLTELTHWSWWVAGVALIIIEMFAPAAFFLWMGISALVTGVLLWLFPGMSWTTQFSLFAVLSITSIIIWRKLFPDVMTKTDQPLLNKRAQQYIGRTFTLEEPVINGVGLVRIDDSTWRVSSEMDIAAGSRIKVIAEEGMTLKIEAI